MRVNVVHVEARTGGHIVVRCEGVLRREGVVRREGDDRRPFSIQRDVRGDRRGMDTRNFSVPRTAKQDTRLREFFVGTNSSLNRHETSFYRVKRLHTVRKYA